LAQDNSTRFGSLLGRAQQAIGAVKNQADEIKARAMQAYRTAPRAGSCADRRKEFLAILPDALRFSVYARDIYTDGSDARMVLDNLTILNLGDGRTAYRSPEGERYAEARVDPTHNQAVVVFRGTRVTVRSDIYTDIASHIGLDTGYYTWAADLVARIVRENPDKSVVVTGQSLGGGLTIYSVLHNPGVRGFAFNPAGLSLLAWAATTPSQRARLNDAVTVISTRNANQIEPISALSFAGRSVLPGHIFVVETNVIDERTLHGPATIVDALTDLSASGVAGSACDGDIGVLTAS
jgi:hypothetical protein